MTATTVRRPRRGGQRLGGGRVRRHDDQFPRLGLPERLPADGTE
ncbi:hypothetical protein ACQPWW_16105 [Micromonospora sp. CA-240977]